MTIFILFYCLYCLHHNIFAYNVRWYLLKQTWVWGCCEWMHLKHEAVAKAWIKHKYMSRKPMCHKCSFWLWKKNNPARRAGEKKNLAPILSEKNFSAQPKIPSHPLNIKWTVPNPRFFLRRDHLDLFFFFFCPALDLPLDGSRRCLIDGQTTDRRTDDGQRVITKGLWSRRLLCPKDGVQ